MATPEQFFLLCLSDLPSGVRIKIKATDTYNVLVTIEAKRGGFGVVSCQEMPSEAVYAAFLMWEAARRACMVYPGSVESAYGDGRKEMNTTLPNSCPECGAGIVIGIRLAVCEANKYLARNGAGDCRWELELTPDLRRQADEALAAQGVSRG